MEICPQKTPPAKDSASAAKKVYCSRLRKPYHNPVLENASLTSNTNTEPILFKTLVMSV